jgi:hypothetical protein
MIYLIRVLVEETRIVLGLVLSLVAGTISSLVFISVIFDLVGLSLEDMIFIVKIVTEGLVSNFDLYFRSPPYSVFFVGVPAYIYVSYFSRPSLRLVALCGGIIAFLPFLYREPGSLGLGLVAFPFGAIGGVVFWVCVFWRRDWQPLR